MTSTLQYQVTGCIDEAVMLQTCILELPGLKKNVYYTCVVLNLGKI